jgi:acetyl esterase/lipase
MGRWFSLLLLAACAGSASNDGETGPYPGFVPDLPGASCGNLDYAWRSTGEVGALIDYERVDDYSLESTQVDALLPLVDMDAFAPVPYSAAVYRMRYTTQEKGQITEATSLVSFPDVNTGESMPTLLLLHGTTGFVDVCAPSNMTILEASPAVVTAALGAVAIHPDYPGMMGMGEAAAERHALLLPESSVIASLDAVRAAEKLLIELGQPVMPDPDRVVFWGLSEGALFALWAERYGRIYLPEWRPKGIVAVAPATNLGALLRESALAFGRRTGVLVAASIGATEWHEESERLDSVFTAAALDDMDAVMDSECDIPEFTDIATVEEVFLPEVLGPVQEGHGVEPISCYLEAAGLVDAQLSADPAVPILWLGAEEDDLALTVYARQDVEAMCSQGLSVVYEECAGFSHEDVLLDTIGRQTEWALARAEGQDLGDPVCVVAPPMYCDG